MRLENEMNRRFDDIVSRPGMFNEAEITIEISQVLVDMKKSIGELVVYLNMRYVDVSGRVVYLFLVD